MRDSVRWHSSKCLSMQSKGDILTSQDKSTPISRCFDVERGRLEACRNRSIHNSCLYIVVLVLGCTVALLVTDSWQHPLLSSSTLSSAACQRSRRVQDLGIRVLGKLQYEEGSSNGCQLPHVNDPMLLQKSMAAGDTCLVLYRCSTCTAAIASAMLTLLSILPARLTAVCLQTRMSAL